nr:hypothetical protein [Pseudomonas aeruginosa]
MGESGSGKSTVVKTLFFDDEPTAGEAHVRAQRRAAALAAQPPLWHGVPEPASGTQFQRLGRRKHCRAPADERPGPLRRNPRTGAQLVGAH